METASSSLSLCLYNSSSVLTACAQHLLPAPELLVELGQRSRLAFALGLQTPPGYPGILGLLAPDAAWGGLAISSAPLAVPCLLTPHQEHGADGHLLGDALQALRGKGPCEVACLMNWQDVPELLPLLSLVYRIEVLWDVRFPPDAHLMTTLQLLQQEGLMATDLWGGWQFYGGAITPELRRRIDPFLSTGFVRNAEVA